MLSYFIQVRLTLLSFIFRDVNVYHILNMTQNMKWCLVVQIGEIGHSSLRNLYGMIC